MGKIKGEYGRLIQHNRTHTEEEKQEIRRLYATGEYTMQKLAGIFNTKPYIISKIVKK